MLRGGRGAGSGGGGTRSLRLRLSPLSRPRKELKDPDQLYTTLKNLLAQIKVGRPPFGGPCANIWLCDGGGAVISWLWAPWARAQLGSPCSPTPVPGPSWSP